MTQLLSVKVHIPMEHLHHHLEIQYLFLPSHLELENKFELLVNKYEDQMFQMSHEILVLSHYSLLINLIKTISKIFNNNIFQK